VPVAAERADDVAVLLMLHGALGCAVESGRARSRHGSRVRLEAFFERLSVTKLRRIENALASAGIVDSKTLKAGLRLVEVTDPGWASAWKERFKPLKIGRRVLVVPPWSEAFEPGRIRVIIDPGQAFGTGSHPTTASVLREIEAELDGRPISSALDVGTGSGILAIALKLLGVKRVIGIDVDRQALQNARHNARLNGVARTVRFLSMSLDQVADTFELIVANICASTLMSMACDFKRLLANSSSLILSGILKREADAVLERYRAEGFIPVRARDSRGWSTLVLRA